MSAHTPGPWTVHQSHVYAPDGAILAVVHNPGSRADEYPLEANARLIAAAPELLELLRQILPFVATQSIGCHGDKCREEWCFSCNGEDDAEAAASRSMELYGKAHSLIAKARGES